MALRHDLSCSAGAARQLHHTGVPLARRPQQRRSKCSSARRCDDCAHDSSAVIPSWSSDPEPAFRHPIHQVGRRQAAWLGLSGCVSLLLAAPTHAEAPAFLQRGLSKYIKKKRLDPLDTYVPLVLEARDQLADAGKLMSDNVASARELLRSGPFDGLRQNVRAVGDYAVVNGRQEQAGPLVNGFFTALEAFDQVLATSIREDTPLDAAAAQAKLEGATRALDALLATIPEDVLERSQRVLQVAHSKQLSVEELELEPATIAKDVAPGATEDAAAATEEEPF